MVYTLGSNLPDDWLNDPDLDALGKRHDEAADCYSERRDEDDFGPCEGCPMSSMCHPAEEDEEELDFFQREADAYYEAEAGTNG